MWKPSRLEIVAASCLGTLAEPAQTEQQNLTGYLIDANWKRSNEQKAYEQRQWLQ